MEHINMQKIQAISRKQIMQMKTIASQLAELGKCVLNLQEQPTSMQSLSSKISGKGKNIVRRVMCLNRISQNLFQRTFSQGAR